VHFVAPEKKGASPDGSGDRALRAKLDFEPALSTQGLLVGGPAGARRGVHVPRDGRLVTRHVRRLKVKAEEDQSAGSDSGARNEEKGDRVAAGAVAGSGEVVILKKERV